MLDFLPSDSDKTKSDISKRISSIRSTGLRPSDVSADNLDEGVALKSNNDVGVGNTISGYKNSVVTKLDGIIGKMSSGKLNSKKMTKNITKAFKVDKNGIYFSQDNLTTAVGRDLGYNVTGKSGAAAQIAKEINKEFQRITGLKFTRIVLRDGTGFKTNETWRSEMAGETLDNLIKFTGISEFLDASVIASVRSVILKNAVKFGLIDGYEQLFNSYPPGFEAFKRDAIIEAIEIAISNGDIVSMEKLVSLLESEGRNTLLSKYPNLVERLFSNFKFASDVTPDDYPAILAALQRLLVGLLGEDWFYRETEFGKALNLAIINHVSQDMKTLLQLWEEIIPLLCCANMFVDTSANIVLRRVFPTAPRFD